RSRTSWRSCCLRFSRTSRQPKMKRARKTAGPFFRVSSRVSRVCLEMEADVLENVAQIAQFHAAGRRRLRVEVEDLAILDAVIDQARDAPLFVEINRDDALVDDFMRHEGDRTGRLLRDVKESIAVDGRDGRRRAEHDQNLLLGCPDRDLL